MNSTRGNQEVTVRSAGILVTMEFEIERTLPMTRRNELEGYTASCFQRIPVFSNYKAFDVRMGVHSLATWVATRPELALVDEVVFDEQTIASAIADGIPEWSPPPRKNVQSMLIRYGAALREQASGTYPPR
jgi:hypothetical protein